MSDATDEPHLIERMNLERTPAYITDPDGDGPRLARVTAALLREIRRRGVLSPDEVVTSGALLAALVDVLLAPPSSATTDDLSKVLTAALGVHGSAVRAIRRGYLFSGRRDLQPSTTDVSTYEAASETDEAFAHAEERDDLSRILNQLMRRLADAPSLAADVRKRVERAILGAVSEEDLLKELTDALARKSPDATPGSAALGSQGSSSSADAKTPDPRPRSKDRMSIRAAEEELQRTGTVVIMVRQAEARRAQEKVERGGKGGMVNVSINDNKRAIPIKYTWLELLRELESAGGIDAAKEGKKGKMLKRLAEWAEPHGLRITYDEGDKRWSSTRLTIMGWTLPLAERIANDITALRDEGFDVKIES
jgi:hypothetical protein